MTDKSQNENRRATAPPLRLGLIGDNIARSKAPILHTLAGRLTGLDVTYERLVPPDLHLTFEETFDRCISGGFRGVNITYPYKERAAARVVIDDPLVRSIGAVNTVLFDPGQARGYNTDYSGFISGYRNIRGEDPAGSVCMIGAGGVGKAIAFALLNLGLGELKIFDRDSAKATALAANLKPAAGGAAVKVSGSLEEAARNAEGLINCTPVGMIGYEGSPLPRTLMHGAKWAFDAVYTPVDTRFLKDAASERLVVISGYELFFFQGVDAWELFSGRPFDQDEMRRLLATG